ncbi:hypothetical protein [Vibrio crassostreae]|uniref:hypothetical protein n=1 Tax=Vibrio crassostreae TaxID=246167 RepID=UPI001B317294|nr:hypothetical protein [Vibrio crassostreae]
MTNKIYKEYISDVEELLNQEAETIRVVKDHLEKIEEAKNARTFAAMFSENGDMSKDIDAIKADIFGELSFMYSSNVDDSAIEILSNASNVNDIEDSVLQMFDEHPDERSKRYLAALVALLKGGVELITKHDLYNLQKIPYQAIFKCPLCGEETSTKITIHAMRTEFISKAECKGCGHTIKPECSCDFCLKNKMIFDMSKVVEKSLLDIKNKANKTLTQHVDDYKVIENDVSMPELLARYTSYKGRIGGQSKEVIDKAIEVFKLTNEFEYETYDYVKNIIGEEDASKVASELCKIGFFYKAGYIPRVNMGVKPLLNLSGENLLNLYLTPEGGLVVSDDEPDEYIESSVIVNNNSKLKVVYDVKPYFLSVFKVNRWALEHEAFGGVYSIEEKQERLTGKIIQNPSVREAFETEHKRGEYYVFPDVKISKVIDVSMLSKVMNSATIKLLDGFEANLVCFDENYEPKRVYLSSGRKGLDIIEAAIQPLLESKGIEIVII